MERQTNESVNQMNDSHTKPNTESKNVLGTERAQVVEPDAIANRLPSLPLQGDPQVSSEPAIDIEIARKRANDAKAEAEAQAGHAGASSLWLEAADLFSTVLSNPRDAAYCYQMAHVENPTSRTPLLGAKRLFWQLGQWSMVVLLIDKEIEIDAEGRAKLLFEKGQILDAKLGQPDLAKAAYEQSWAEDKGYGPAIESLALLFSKVQDHQGLAKLLQESILHTQEGAQQTERYIWLARVLEFGVADWEGAIDALEKAHVGELDKHNVLQGLRRLYNRQGSDDKQSKVLAELAAIAENPSDAIEFHMDRARLLFRKGDLREALSSLESALEIEPHSRDALFLIVDVYEGLAKWEEMRSVLELRATAEDDKLESAILMGQAARICHYKLNDILAALELYKQSAKLCPEYQPSIEAWGKICAQENMWTELAEVFDTQLLALADADDRVPLLFKLSDLLAERLHDYDRAITLLLEILELKPAYGPALKAVSQLYAKQGKFEDLVGVYTAELDGPIDSDQAIYLLEKIASLLEKELDAPERAVDTYKKMLRWRSGYLPAIRALGRLFARLERWEELIEINIEEAHRVGDQTQMVALYTRNGEVLLEQLGDEERAVGALEEALSLQPTYLPALRLLGRLYAQSERWGDLIEMHRQEAEVTNHAGRRAQLLYQVAMVYSNHLSDQDKAISVLMEILSDQAGYQPAVHAVKKIAKETGNVEPELRLYENQIAILGPSRERSAIRCDLGRLLMANGKNKEAFAQWAAAAAETPSFLTANELLAHHYSLIGDVKGEVDIREQLSQLLADSNSQEANLMHLADLYMYVDDSAWSNQSSHTWERVLVLSPENVRALFERIRAEVKRKNYTNAVAVGEELTGRLDNPADIISVQTQIIAWKEGHSDPPRDSLENHLTILQYDPLNPVSLAAVERAYRDANAWAALIELYRHEIERTSVIQRKADLCVSIGTISMDNLGDAAVAQRCFEQAIELQPEQLTAVNRLLQIYEELQDTPNRLRMLTILASTSKETEQSLKTLRDIATVQLEELGDERAAMATYLALLRKDPNDTEAFEKLEKYCTRDSHWSTLVELYGLRIPVVKEIDAMVHLRMKRGRILHENLPRVAEACAEYEALLAVAPTQAEALLELGRLRFDCGQWDDALATFQRLTTATQDPAWLSEAHLKMGTILCEHRPDISAAIQHLSNSIQYAPQDFEARHRLATVLSQAGRSDEALQVANELLALAPSIESERRFYPVVEANILLARLFAGPRNAPADAGACYLRAAEAAPDVTTKVSMLEKAAALYEANGLTRDLILVRDILAGLLSTSDPERAVFNLSQNVAAMADSPDQMSTMIEIAQRALALGPKDLEIRRVLATALSVNSMTAKEGVSAHREIIADAPGSTASIEALYKIWVRDRNYDGAFVAADLHQSLHEPDAELVSFMERSRSRLGSDSDEVLSDDEIERWLVHPKQRGIVHEILSAVSGDLGKAMAHDLSMYQVERKDVLSRRSNAEVRLLGNKLSQILGSPSFDMWLCSSPPIQTVNAHHGNPAVLAMGLDFSEQHSLAVQRYLIGKELMAVRCGHAMVAGMDSTRLLGFLNAIGVAVDRRFPVLVDHPDQETMVKKIQSALSRSLKRQLVEPVSQLLAEKDRLGLDDYLNYIDYTQARAGLFLCEEISTPLQFVVQERGARFESKQELADGIAQHPIATDLVSFAVSDEHLQARQRARSSIDA
jgi:cellulose synthase operon protein C